MRDNWLSNRIFESYAQIVDQCCDAWNKLIDQPWKIMSIGLQLRALCRQWDRRSRILGAMPSIGPQAHPGAPGGPNTLFDTLAAADAAVRSNAAIVDVQDKVNTSFLGKLSFSDDPLAATLDLGAKGSFDQMLERLELYLNPRSGSERVMRGLGYNNLLFMAAELLLLQSHPDQVPFLLIEEPEAHLHPQHQTLFMDVLAARAAKPSTAEAEQVQQVQITSASALTNHLSLIR